MRIKNTKNTFTVNRVSDLLDNGFDANILAEEFVRVSKVIWSEVTTNQQYVWTIEQVRSHFNICPDLIYCAFANGKMVATLTNMRTTERDFSNSETWLEKTGNGYLTTHISNGEIGFGVDLAVTKEAPRKTSDKLVLASIFISALGEGLKSVQLGARIPSYHKHKYMKVEDYVYGTRKSGKPLDPELYFYIKDGFELVGIIPKYMEDPDSLNYGVLIKWDNPLYKVTKTLPFFKPVIRWIGKKLFLRVPKNSKNV